jgi:hypothetical protein
MGNCNIRRGANDTSNTKLNDIYSDIETQWSKTFNSRLHGKYPQSYPGYTDELQEFESNLTCKLQPILTNPVDIIRNDYLVGNPTSIGCTIYKIKSDADLLNDINLKYRHMTFDVGELKSTCDYVCDMDSAEGSQVMLGRITDKFGKTVVCDTPLECIRKNMLSESLFDYGFVVIMNTGGISLRHETTRDVVKPQLLSQTQMVETEKKAPSFTTRIIHDME